MEDKHNQFPHDTLLAGACHVSGRLEDTYDPNVEPNRMKIEAWPNEIR